MTRRINYLTHVAFALKESTHFACYKRKDERGCSARTLHALICNQIAEELGDVHDADFNRMHFLQECGLDLDAAEAL